MNRLTKDLKTPHDDTTYSDVVVNAIDRENIVLTKLKHYEDLEEEIGCPLNVLFKAMKDQDIYHHFFDIVEVEGLYVDAGGIWNFYCSEPLCSVRLENYGKTWWLKGDRKE